MNIIIEDVPQFIIHCFIPETNRHINEPPRLRHIFKYLYSLYYRQGYKKYRLAKLCCLKCREYFVNAFTLQLVVMQQQKQILVELNLICFSLLVHSPFRCIVVEKVYALSLQMSVVCSSDIFMGRHDFFSSHLK